MPVVPLLVGVSDLFKINCGFSLFPNSHVWSLSPHEHFLCVEYRLSQILETSKEELSPTQNITKVKEHTMEAVVVQNSTDQIAANINIYY